MPARRFERIALDLMLGFQLLSVQGHTGGHGTAGPAL